VATVPSPAPPPTNAPVILPATLELPPRQVNVPDPDASLVPWYAVAGATVIRIGAIGTTPDATLTLRVYFLGSNNTPIGTASIQFSTRSTSDFAGTYTADPTYDPSWPLGGAKAVCLKADTVQGGSWTLVGSLG
jgi:hypothetical protein